MKSGLSASDPFADIGDQCSNAGMNTDDLRNAIYAASGSLRSGSLSFWGDWFGRSYNNIHQIVGAESLNGAVIIYFDHAESLIVDAPQRWSLDGGKLVIREAERVRFQWFYYSQMPGPESLRFVEYRWVSGEPSFKTDFQPEILHQLDISAPAVQLHALG